MTSKLPPLIIPVENQVRELDAKLLMACAAAERGYPVILGSRPFVNFAMPYLPRGIFLAKSLRSISALMLRCIRGLGHEVIAWDEESLVRFASPEYFAWRYSAETFGAVSRLFAWGDDDAELFASYEGYTGVPIHATGNPRMDLLRPELRGYFDTQTEDLRKRFGDFILVNTNFPFVNAFVPGLNLLQPRADGGGIEVGRTGRGLSLPLAQRMAAHIQAIHDHFRELIPHLHSWFPDHTVIIRPHPSEDHAAWRDVVGGQPGVHVIHEGNVIPWLQASRVLLHNGCTTAVEAAVLGKPAVAFQPTVSDEFDYHLPNSLSHRAFTHAQVREQLGAVLSGQLGLIDEDELHRILGRHLASTSGPLAVDRVMDVLEESGAATRGPVRPGQYAYAWLRTNWRTTVKLFNMMMRPQHRNSASYHAHRFPAVSVEEIRRRIGHFSRLLGRFESIRVEPSSKYIFRLTSARNARRGAGIPMTTSLRRREGAP